MTVKQIQCLLAYLGYDSRGGTGKQKTGTFWDEIKHFNRDEDFGKVQ